VIDNFKIAKKASADGTFMKFCGKKYFLSNFEVKMIESKFFPIGTVFIVKIILILLRINSLIKPPLCAVHMD
jgi:hypothetical protein